MNIPK